MQMKSVRFTFLTVAIALMSITAENPAFAATSANPQRVVIAQAGPGMPVPVPQRKTGSGSLTAEMAGPGMPVPVPQRKTGGSLAAEMAGPGMPVPVPQRKTGSGSLTAEMAAPGMPAV